MDLWECNIYCRQLVVAAVDYGRWGDRAIIIE